MQCEDYHSGFTLLVERHDDIAIELDTNLFCINETGIPLTLSPRQSNLGGTTFYDDLDRIATQSSCGTSNSLEPLHFATMLIPCRNVHQNGGSRVFTGHARFVPVL